MNHLRLTTPRAGGIMANAEKPNYPQQPLNVLDNVVDRPYTVQRLIERPTERIVDKPVTMERVIERLVVDTVAKWSTSRPP